MELYLEVRKMYHGNRASRALSNSETWHRHPTGTRRPGACGGGHQAVRGASERRDCHSHPARASGDIDRSCYHSSVAPVSFVDYNPVTVPEPRFHEVSVLRLNPRLTHSCERERCHYSEFRRLD